MRARVKYKIQNFTIWITNYSDYDLIRVNKKCGKSYKKVKQMLLQISIALTIKNLTILTKKLKCDEASTGQLYDWVS